MKDIIYITDFYAEHVYKSNLQIYGCFHVIRSVIALCHCMLLRTINGSHKDNGLGLIRGIIGDHIIELSINAHMLWKAQTGINGFLPINAIYELSICSIQDAVNVTYGALWVWCIPHWFPFISSAKTVVPFCFKTKVKSGIKGVYRLRCIYEGAQSRSAASFLMSFLVSMWRSVFKKRHNP